MAASPASRSVGVTAGRRLADMGAWPHHAVEFAAQHTAVKHADAHDFVEWCLSAGSAQSDGQGAFHATIGQLSIDYRRHRPVDGKFTGAYLLAQFAIVHHDVHRGSELIAARQGLTPTAPVTV